MVIKNFELESAGERNVDLEKMTKELTNQISTLQQNLNEMSLKDKHNYEKNKEL